MRNVTTSATLFVAAAMNAVSGVDQLDDAAEPDIAAAAAPPRELDIGAFDQAEALTEEIPNMLAVPGAAVHAQNGASVVTVLDPNPAGQLVVLRATP